LHCSTAAVSSKITNRYPDRASSLKGAIRLFRLNFAPGRTDKAVCLIVCPQTGGHFHGFKVKLGFMTTPKT
jgi:hypothetical protein